MSWKSFSGGGKNIFSGGKNKRAGFGGSAVFGKGTMGESKGNKKDWLHFLHPLEKIDEMPEESKPREAPVLDDDQKRMNFEKEEQKRRAKVGRVSTMLSENSTLG